MRLLTLQNLTLALHFKFEKFEFQLSFGVEEPVSRHLGRAEDLWLARKERIVRWGLVLAIWLFAAVLAFYPFLIFLLLLTLIGVGFWGFGAWM